LPGSASGERPVVGERPDAEPDRAVAGIGEAGLDEPVDQRDHLGNVTSGTGLDRGRQDAEGGVRFVEGPGLAGRQLPHGGVVVRGIDDDLVVDVGDVLDEGHVVTRGREPASEYVQRDRSAEVADVGGGLHGGSTDVHAHMTGAQRLERPPAPGARVVKVESH
jgi:hypothetical protein